jgi:hypothetical protein
MSNAIEPLTPEQELELAACYCEWCGVDESDRNEWRSEMVTAKRYVRKWMAYWRDREKRKRNGTKPQPIVEPCQRCKESYEKRIDDLLRRSGLDVSPCRICGIAVVCVPDGLACCKQCAEKAGG